MERVIELATQALSTGKPSAPLLLARARAHEALGRLSDAVADYGLALALSPVNTAAQEGLRQAQALRRKRSEERS